MSLTCLTDDELAVLRRIARQDVRYWDWTAWAKQATRWGQYAIGSTWVLLPHKPDKVMPALRREMNRVYWDALVEIAAEYGFDLSVDQQKQKIVLLLRASAGGADDEKNKVYEAAA